MRLRCKKEPHLGSRHFCRVAEYSCLVWVADYQIEVNLWWWYRHFCMCKEWSSQAQSCNGQQNHIAKRMKLPPCNQSDTLSPCASHIKRVGNAKMVPATWRCKAELYCFPSACSIVRKITAPSLKRYTDDSYNGKKNLVPIDRQCLKMCLRSGQNGWKVNLASTRSQEKPTSQAIKQYSEKTVHTPLATSPIYLRPCTTSESLRSISEEN